MAFKAGNRMNPRQQNAMNELFALIETSNSELLKDELNMHKLRVAFTSGFDGQSEEQEQYNGSNSDKNVSNAQLQYDKQRIAARSMGTTADSFDRNRAASMNEANDNEFTKLKSQRSKDYSGFAKVNYSS